MTQPEYKNKKRECWEECIREYGYLDPAHAFNLAFARAYALGKQEKDAEDTVIQGWVAIDEAYGECFLHTEKPTQKAQPIADTGDYDTVWDSEGETYLLDVGLFLDMDSDSEPQKVEIIIKRKKK